MDPTLPYLALPVQYPRFPDLLSANQIGIAAVPFCLPVVMRRWLRALHAGGNSASAQET